MKYIFRTSYPFPLGDKSKVLRDTCVGRTKKLSLYRSKPAMKRKSEQSASENGDIRISPNYTKVIKVTNDEEINVVDVVLDAQENSSLNSDSGESVDVQVQEEEKFEVLDNVKPDEDTSFQMKCMQRLKNDTLIRNVVCNLDAEGNLEDFVSLMEQIGSGEMPCNNIVLLLLLDRVRFQKCGNTVGMRYRKVTKLFWSIVYRLCKGVGLKFFGGSKNWGQVVAKECGKSHYKPHLSNINFAVPDEKVL